MSVTIPINRDFGVSAFKFNFNDALQNNVCKDFDVIIDIHKTNSKKNIYTSIAKYSLLSGNYKIITYYNSVMTKSQNDISVNDFNNSPDDIIYILSSYRSINEGIDVKTVIVYVSANPNIIQ